MLLLSPEIMADHDMVLKFWGPVEADYTTHGGLVLTRSVALIKLFLEDLKACKLLLPYVYFIFPMTGFKKRFLF